MKDIKAHIDEQLGKIPEEQRKVFDAIIDFYEAQLSQRDERIKELESRLNKDSRTSSKPPSSDGQKNVRSTFANALNAKQGRSLTMMAPH